MERVDPPFEADERSMLGAFLDFHRATLLDKAAGLSKQQLNTTTAASSLTLAGLLKHLALVEDAWFQETFLGAALPPPWTQAALDADPDWDFHSAPSDEPAALVELYTAACERSRAVVRYAASLDAVSVGKDRHGERHFSLRWILLHMIEETARHNGHADLIRESIDGATGE